MIETIAALLPGLAKLAGSGGGSKSSASSSLAATVSPSIVNVVGSGQADANSGGTASSSASSSAYGSEGSGGYGSFPWLPTGTYGSGALPQNRFDDISTVRVPGAVDQGFDLGTLLLIGGAGLVAFLTLSK